MTTARFEESLKTTARSSTALMEALHIARRLKLTEWCIAAGAVRNLVWDSLHGYQSSVNNSEIDLVYFDPFEADETERCIQDGLNRSYPDWIWDVTNQAVVHRWYEREFGQTVSPLSSLMEGIGSWPEFATCVGLSLTDTDELVVLAPHGLTDLFSLHVRHNPARAPLAVARERMKAKRWLNRWPGLKPIGDIANAV